MTQIKGHAKLKRNLNREIAKIEGDVYGGLKAAVAHVLTVAKSLAPRDLGVLINSGFSDATKNAKRIEVRVGFTAKYAPWVHEMPMKLKGQPRADFGKGVKFGGGSGRGTYWDSGENKFLEKAVRRNQEVILAIVKKRAKR